MTTMILVTGGRSYEKPQLVYRMLDETAKKYPDMILVHGGASGADAYANDWAIERQMPCFRFPGRWRLHNRAAGPIRNREMLGFMKRTRELMQDRWTVLAFPSKHSVGTRDMMKIAGEEGFQVIDVDEFFTSKQLENKNG